MALGNRLDHLTDSFLAIAPNRWKTGLNSRSRSVTMMGDAFLDDIVLDAEIFELRRQRQYRVDPGERWS